MSASASKMRTDRPAVHVDVREATAADAPLVAQSFREYLEWLGEDLTFQKVSSELSAPLDGVYRAPAGRVLLAWLPDGEVAGVVAVKPLPPWKEYSRVCEMKRLFVRDRYRGLGIGRLLSERIIEVSRTIGYEVMVLDTLARLSAAVALYRELGFVPCEPYYENPLPTVMYFSKHLQ